MGDSGDFAERVKRLSLTNLVLENGLDGLGFLEPKVVTLERGDLSEEDFEIASWLATVEMEELGGYKVMGVDEYGSETCLTVRKSVLKSVCDFICNHSHVHELRRVPRDDGSFGLACCTNYFVKGKILSSGWSELSDYGKRVAEGYPMLVRGSSSIRKPLFY